MGDQEPESEQDNHVYGSVLNPSNINGAGGAQKKDLAKPYSKMEVKAGEKPPPLAESAAGEAQDGSASSQ